MADTDNLAVMRRYYDEVVNKGDYAGTCLPFGMSRNTRAGFPDLVLTLDDIFGEDDLVASRWTLRGTHTEEWFGTPATGKSADWAGVVLSRFEDGKIAEEWFNFDQLRLLQQLGIIPSE